MIERFQHWSIGAALFVIVGLSGDAAARSGSPNPAESPAARAFQASYAAEAAGRFDTALGPLDALPASTKTSYVVQLRRGWLLYRAGKLSQSIGAYSAATTAAPDAVEPRLGQLLPLLALRRWGEAEKIATEVLSRDPGSLPGRLRLAYALYALGRHKDAEVAYARVLALHPADLEARSGLAWSQLNQASADKVTAAIENFSALLEIAPRHPLAAEGLATARKRLTKLR